MTTLTSECDSQQIGEVKDVFAQVSGANTSCELVGGGKKVFFKSRISNILTFVDVIMMSPNIIFSSN